MAHQFGHTCIYYPKVVLAYLITKPGSQITLASPDWSGDYKIFIVAHELHSGKPLDLIPVEASFEVRGFKSVVRTEQAHLTQFL